MELTITHIFAILALTGLLLAMFGMALAVYCLIEVKSLQRSTHQIQFMPVDEAIDKENQDFINSLQTRDMEPEISHKDMWATTDDTLDKQRELYRDELERSMPEFVEDDKPEIMSF